jgi:DNA adenine methylase Dam
MRIETNKHFVNPPFNYTGSKIKLLDQILPLFDYTKNNFVDLFCGGGSVYTNVLDKYEKILANDIISDLIEIHKKLLNSPNEFITLVENLASTKYDQQKFLNLRETYNNNKSPEGLYALMLCCTNNMIRFNLKNEFNSTWGKRQFNEKTREKLNIFVNHISKYKEKIEYSSKNFYDIKLQESSMIYCDPPYTNAEAGYNSYWNKNLENKLYLYLKKMDNDGHSFALSGLLGEHKNNKRSEIVDNLISDGFNYKILDHNYEAVARRKNSKNSVEIIIFNY